jgi:hypothetical protein
MLRAVRSAGIVKLASKTLKLFLTLSWLRRWTHRQLPTKANVGRSHENNRIAYQCRIDVA